MTRITQTTPAIAWESIAQGSLPRVFINKFPKAIMLNEAGNVVLKGSDGAQVTFTPAVGVPIQLRPTEIVSITATAIIVLYN